MAAEHINPGILKREAIKLYQGRFYAESGKILEGLYARGLHDPEVIFLLGMICSKRGDLIRSVQFLTMAAESKPDYSDARYNLALILHRRGECESAVRELERVIAEDPQYLSAYLALGHIQMVNGQYGDAVECFRAAQRLEPENPEAVSREAEVYERLGDIERAYKIIKPYLKDGLTNPYIAYIYGRLAIRLDDCEEVISRLTGVIGKNDMPEYVRATLNFTLGDLYDKTQRYNEAFHHYRIGNRLLRKYFNINKHQKLIDQKISIFSDENLAKMPRSDCRSELPVFVIGMPRSGTSLVEQILSSHNDIHGAGELKVMDTLISDRECEMYDQQGAEGNELVTREWLNKAAEKYINNLSYMSSMALRGIDKMPGNYLLLGLIELIFPNARVIHCKRNALDTCLSCFFKNFTAGHNYTCTLKGIGNYYLDYQRLMAHWKEVLDIPIYEVNYEDLVENPESEIRKLVEFCGVGWDEKCLKHAENMRIVKTASYLQANKPIYRDSLGRWRNYEKHIGKLVDILGDNA